MSIKFIAYLLMSALLSGCWGSKQLLIDKKLTETPFESGKYVHTIKSKDGADTVQSHVLVRNGNGYYDADGNKQLILNRFKGKDNVFVFAYGNAGDWAYGLLIPTKAGIYLKLPGCEAYKKEAIAMALSFGASVEGNTCLFADKDSLMKAMTQFYQITSKDPGTLYQKEAK